MNTKRMERLERKAYALRVEREHAETMLEYSVAERRYYAAKKYCKSIIKANRKLAKAQKKFEKSVTRNHSKKHKSMNEEEVMA